MEIEEPIFYKEKPTELRKIDLFGGYKKNSPDHSDFDFREEVEPIGLPMASLKVDAIYLYFKNLD